ncbi:hypothetical protein GALL_544270 [mine drainage metagenome]|uniref:Uncharacterized protein n=1 Tax=mine drainage metagenome TaxID=410659 RepID=A0A1J5PFJ4_9ZZZZ
MNRDRGTIQIRTRPIYRNRATRRPITVICDRRVPLRIEHGVTSHLKHIPSRINAPRTIRSSVPISERISDPHQRTSVTKDRYSRAICIRTRTIDRNRATSSAIAVICDRISNNRPLRIKNRVNRNHKGVTRRIGYARTVGGRIPTSEVVTSSDQRTSVTKNRDS